MYFSRYRELLTQLKKIYQLCCEQIFYLITKRKFFVIYKSYILH